MYELYSGFVSALDDPWYKAAVIIAAFLVLACFMWFTCAYWSPDNREQEKGYLWLGGAALAGAVMFLVLGKVMVQVVSVVLAGGFVILFGLLCVYALRSALKRPQRRVR